MPKQGPYVADLEPGRALAGEYLILDAVKAQSSRGSDYLNLFLTDRTGKIGAKVWNLTPELEQTLQSGQVVWASGQVEAYRGQPQALVKEAASLDQALVNWREFILAAARPAPEMRADLGALVATVADDDYRWLLETALAHPQICEALNSAPAAKSFHHAYLGGLLEHTLSVAQLAELVAGHYPQLNRSLLITGAVLHDLGKLWEFTAAPQIELTTSGRLLGHLVMGLLFFQEIINSAPGFPAEKAVLLEHLVISHHGEYEFGSPKKPKILEGLALHFIDDLDAKINGLGGFIGRRASAETGWTDYNRLMEQYFFDPAKGFPGLAPNGPARESRAAKPARKRAARAVPPAVGEPPTDEPAPPDEQNWLF